jgi:hypothetical protein
MLGAPVTLGGGCVVRALEDRRGDMELKIVFPLQKVSYVTVVGADWTANVQLPRSRGEVVRSSGGWTVEKWSRRGKKRGNRELPGGRIDGSEDSSARWRLYHGRALPRCRVVMPSGAEKAGSARAQRATGGIESWKNDSGRL